MRWVIPGIVRCSSLVRIGPSDSLHRIVPFHRPSMTDSMASIGQAEISFFETAILPLLNRSNPLTNLSVRMIESVYGPMASEVQERRMTVFLYIATTVCIGLLIGTEFAVSVFINPVLRKLDDRTQAKAVSLFAARLGRAMPFWYGLSLLLLLIEAIV